jgi:hypothetical protein
MSKRTLFQDLEVFDTYCWGWCSEFLAAKMSLETRGHMIRWPIALITLAALLGCSANPRRKYNLEGAPLFLFEQNHTPTPCEQSHRTGARLVAGLSNRPAHSVQRTDRMDLSLAQLPVFSMHLEPSIFEVYGGTSDNYSVQLCAEAGAATESDAKALLGEVKLTRVGKTLLLSTPKYVQERPSTTFVQVQAPQETPITVNGEYAAMRVIGMHAAVKLSTTHARITLIDTTGDVDAKAAEFGVIDFSGDRGHVHLESASEINLNFTGQKFDGSLDAKAAGPVRVLLPPGFASGFEATVRDRSDFACRADICDRVSLQKRNGKFVFTFGSGDPSLHFTSLDGPVVVDSSDRLATIKGPH